VALALGGAILFGLTRHEVDTGLKLLRYLSDPASEGFAAFRDPGFREAYKVGDYLESILPYLGIVVLSLGVAPWLVSWRRRDQLRTSTDVRRALALALLPLLGGAALPILHFAGFRAPHFVAFEDDYRGLWDLWHIGLLGAVAGLVAWAWARLVGTDQTSEVDAEVSGAAPPSRRTRAIVAAVAALALFHGLAFSALTVLRHQAFRSATHDLGLYDQMMWNLLDRKGFRVTTWLFPGEALGEYFNGLQQYRYDFTAEHAMPVLYLLAPFYWLVPRAETFLVLQSLALGAAAFFLFLAARSILRCDWLAAVFAAAFVLHPTIHEANLKDFHADALQPLFLAVGLWGWQRRSYWLYSPALLAFALCKEDASLLALAWGIYLLTIRDWTFAAIALGIGLGCHALMREIAESARDGEPLRHLWRYRHLAFPAWNDQDVLSGKVPEGIGALARGFFTNPWAALNPNERLSQLGAGHPPILSHERVRSLLMLGVPLGFAALLSWRSGILLLIPLATALLSNWDHNFRMRMHYGLNSHTWMVVASMLALGEWLQRRRASDRSIRPAIAGWGSCILLAALLVSWRYGRMPGMGAYDGSTYRKPPSAALAPQFMSPIGADDAVAASNNLGPHLTQRRNLMLFPEVSWYDHRKKQLRPVDWILVDTLAHPWPLDSSRYRAEVEALLRGGNYGVWPATGYRGGLLLLRYRGDKTLNESVLADLKFGIY